MSISFSHHMEILSGVKTLEERLFYIHETAQNKSAADIVSIPLRAHLILGRMDMMSCKQYGEMWL